MTRMCATTSRPVNLSWSPKPNQLKFIHNINQTDFFSFFSAVLAEKNPGFSYLMDEYGRLRVREYNTLHRAIRKSSWGPVRCNIALHLRRETVMGYSPSNLNTMSIICRRQKKIMYYSSPDTFDSLS